METQKQLELILEEAGYWANPMHQALNYLEHYDTLQVPERPYNLIKHQALGILGHFRMFSTPQVYEFYKKHYERITNERS